jgi:hypothetical protein
MTLMKKKPDAVRLKMSGLSLQVFSPQGRHDGPLRQRRAGGTGHVFIRAMSGSEFFPDCYLPVFPVKLTL